MTTPAMLVALAACLGLARPAEAYLDPGSGSYLLQLLLAGLLSALVTLKIYWRRLRDWLGSVFRRRDERR